MVIIIKKQHNTGSNESEGVRYVLLFFWWRVDVKAALILTFI